MTGVDILLGGILAFVLLIGLLVWRQDRLRHAQRKP